MANDSISMGAAVDCIPTLRPEIIFVAGPVIDCLTIDFTGVVPVPVYYSVLTPIPNPARSPIKVA